LIGLVGLLIARLRGMRFIALLEDLYPDVGVAIGIFPARSWVVRPLMWLSQMVMRRADRLVVLSDCMYEQVIARLGVEAAGRIDIIHNWADGVEIKPMPQAKQTFFSQRQLAEVADKFVVLFSGNFGLVNDFTTVFSAAKVLLRNETEADQFAFVFIGAGAREEELRARIADQQLTNVYLLPYEPREQMPYALAAADVLLITLADGLAGLSMPSKTYSSLAAGRPLLYIGDQRSSLASLIAASHCGVTLANGESARLVELLRGWSRDKAAWAAQGQCARALFERRFRRALAVQAYLETFHRCLYGKEAAAFGPAHAKHSAAPQLAHLSAKTTLNVPAVSLATPAKMGERLKGPAA
jgi:glycosyltransferase involved in cell wall biosynthesis